MPNNKVLLKFIINKQEARAVFFREPVTGPHADLSAQSVKGKAGWTGSIRSNSTGDGHGSSDWGPSARP